MLRLDPSKLTLWQYQAILHEHNRRHDPDAAKGGAEDADFGRLKRALTAHQSATAH